MQELHTPQIKIQNPPISSPSSHAPQFTLSPQISSTLNITTMSKRSINTTTTTNKHLKSTPQETETTTTDDDGSVFNKLNENLLYEILKHADAKTLAVSSCVSRNWNTTAHDERLWELMCTRRWSNVNHVGGEKQLRSVVLALGGFRRLYLLYLSKTAVVAPPIAAARVKGGKRWGKDEVNLSLSLLSIRYYEKMKGKSI